MPAWRFLTVPDELLGEASAVASHYHDLGYRVTVEPRELGYPFAPTLRAVRKPTTVFVEVDKKVRIDRAKEWTGYASSCSTDTQVVIALPSTARVGVQLTLRLQRLGVGVLMVADGVVNETIAPRDLTMNVSLPTISRDPAAIRSALGPAYEHFGRAQWREGFEDACVVLEQSCRKYLWKALQSGRVTVMKPNGRPKVMTKQTVENLTMGQLAGDMSRMTPQTHSDSVLVGTLQALNRDRVRVAHKKREPAAERALRTSVPVHMWRIVQALREIHAASGGL